MTAYGPMTQPTPATAETPKCDSEKHGTESTQPLIATGTRNQGLAIGIKDCTCQWTCHEYYKELALDTFILDEEQWYRINTSVMCRKHK